MDTIHGLVAGWAARTPSAVAVSSETGTLTYRALHMRAGELAAVLRLHGVGTESRVGVVMPRSPEAIVAFLGALTAGAAYVPLDPSYPADRLAFMVADCGIEAVVTVPSARSAVASDTLPVITLDGDCFASTPRAPATAVAAPPEAAANQSAYVIYTSGSTGQPKGVVAEHRNVVALLSEDPRLAIAPGETVAHLAPTAFDASVFEIWGALCRGGQVLIFGGSPPTVTDLGAQLRANRPDWLFLTTGLFHLLAGFDAPALRYAGTLLTGGDTLLPARIRAAAAMTRTYAAYGPTESTVYASLHAASADDLVPRVPLGSALAGTHFHVLDDSLEPASAGTIGELFIGGSGVSRGYHRRPRLTAERFLPDLCGQAPGARMYRTGDLARVLPDGEIEFHGRIDRQVKVRGFRVEPGEIENVLLAAPKVASAVVSPVVSGDGNRRLVAYLAPLPGTTLAVPELRAWAMARLPDHALPAAYILLGDLPLSSNGKLDRRSLPEPWTSRNELQGLPEYRAPSTDVEQLIASTWAEALELDLVGVADEFYLLGGDSIRSIVVLERLRAAGLSCTAAQFFSHPTVAQLAASLQAETVDLATAG